MIVGPWWTWGWGWGGGYGGYYDDYYAGYGNGTYYDNRVYDDRAYDNGAYPQPNGAARPANLAGLEVQLPNQDAEVWLQGQRQSGSGTMRRFYSPQLEPGKTYTYTIDAAWYENGELVTQKRQVDVQADTLARIDFTGPQESGPQEPAQPDAQSPVNPPPPPPQTPPPSKTPAPPRPQVPPDAAAQTATKQAA